MAASYRLRILAACLLACFFVAVTGSSTRTPDFELDTSRLARLLNKTRHLHVPNNLNFLTKDLTSGSVPLLRTNRFADITALAKTVFADDFGLLPNSSYDVSVTCLNHTELLLAGILNTEQWALRMLDAMGKPHSGLMDGNLQWLGSYDECVSVQAVVYGDPVNKTDPQSHPYTGRYCKASFSLSSAQPTLISPLGLSLTIGLCVPNSCSDQDVTALINTGIFALPFNTSTLPEPTVVCQLESLDFDAKAIVAIVVCSVLGAIIVLGTAYDIIIIQWSVTPPSDAPETRASPSEKYTPSGDGSGTPSTTYGSTVSTNNSQKVPVAVSDETKLELKDGSHDAGDEQLVVNIKQDTPQKEKSKQCPPMYQPGTLGKVLLAFSLYTNASKILNTSQPAGTLSAVNGIRFLSLSWVILGHTVQFLLTSADNVAPFIQKVQKRWTFQAVANETFSVDSFFLMSGLLVAYLTLKGLKKSGGIKGFSWGLFYFHRFWRLTPPYMLVAMVYVCLMKYWTNGPLWIQTGTEVNECRDTWWRNLLYINNLFDDGKYCMAWSWYLANDMQFFVVSPLLLIPLYYSSVAGGLVALVFLLVCFISSGVISASKDLPANVMFSQDPADVYDLYYKPYTRIGPYIIGLVAGYILYRTQCKLRIPKALNLIGWAAAAGTALAALYGLYNPDDNLSSHLDTGVAAFYNALSRTAWGVAVAWVIVACATGHGGFVDTLLSWSVFVPLGRLTYCTYLFHPVVMYLYFTSRATPIHLSDLTVIYIFLGNLFVSYGMAFLVSLAFEAPMMGLEKALLGRGKNS